MTLSALSMQVAGDAAARAAIVQTLPLFEMMRMRAATTARRHPTLGFAAPDRGSTVRWVNQFTHTHRRLGPDDREVVSPNNDTVYSNSWLDLSDGPVVIASGANQAAACAEAWESSQERASDQRVSRKRRWKKPKWPMDRAPTEAGST